MNNSIRKVAFIPARSGSKRIPDKNILPLNRHPLLAYSISSALQSQLFDAVICVTDSEYYAQIARYYGAEVPFLRPATISQDASPDIDWVYWILSELANRGRTFEAFSILRPTSPFRLPETIRRAWSLFHNDSRADSLRAVEKCKQHPGKIWAIRGNRMFPLMPLLNGETPWHSSQYAALPEFYIQNASLEFAWSKIALEQKSIAGEVIMPFINQGIEGFDINDPEDVILAQHFIKTQSSLLPEINIPPYMQLEMQSG